MATIEQSLLAELKSIRMALAAAHKGRATPRHAALAHACAAIERSLERPLRIAVLGEEKSGKSLLINYLLKHQILPSGGFAGDSTEILIRYAPEPSVHSVRADGFRNRLTSKAFDRLVKPENRVKPSTPSVIYDALNTTASPARSGPNPANLVFAAPKKVEGPSRLIEVGLPLEFLKQVEIVEIRVFPKAKPDSPVSRAFRQVGAAVWCTLATQAWKETEALAWKRIPAVHRKGALLLVTYKDAIRHEKDEAKIAARLRYASAALFDEVALVSLRDAVQSLLSPDVEEAGQLRAESNIKTVEKAIALMLHNWHAQRLQKVGRLLDRIAGKLGAAAQDRDIGATGELALRLQRLALGYLRASPSVSLSVQAA